MVSTIEVFYKETTAKVLSSDGDMEFFETLVGVLQGDNLALSLFIIVLDYAMKKQQKMMNPLVLDNNKHAAGGILQCFS